jgi:hypothetical protein
LGRVYYCFSNIIQDYYPQWEDVLTNQYNGTGYGIFLWFRWGCFYG